MDECGVSGNEPELLEPTDEEINFLWSFIQGSIMVPETWNALLRSYGFCERHAWIHFGVEVSFRDEYLLGPTILYAELINKALHAISVPRSIGLPSLEHELRAYGTCFLCRMNLQNGFAGASPQTRLDRGRDNTTLRHFAGRLEAVWRGFLCSECAELESAGSAPTLCRHHLLAAAKAHMPVDVLTQRNLLRGLADRVARYHNSFLVGGPKANDQDRAALIAAVGWCSGWRPLLALLARGY
jgi:hypothetical protein